MEKQFLALTKTMQLGKEVSLNSKKRSIRCSDNWLCKRMTCSFCRLKRRAFFVNNATVYCAAHEINTHFIVSWRRLSKEHPWTTIQRQLPKLSKAASGKIGKYIRTIGIGGRCSTPHIHYLLQSERVEKLRGIALRKGPPGTDVEVDVTYDPEGLLGYFYDQNFLVAHLDPERPRRIRIISGSRGSPCGFPKHYRPRTRRRTC